MCTCTLYNSSHKVVVMKSVRLNNIKNLMNLYNLLKTLLPPLGLYRLSVCILTRGNKSDFVNNCMITVIYQVQKKMAFKEVSMSFYLIIFFACLCS